MLRITPIQTGTATAKTAQVSANPQHSPVQRKLDILRDSHWTAPMPIHCWLIEHPEGLFLVDTGDTALNSVPGYLPTWNPFFTREVKIRVAPDEEVGWQLRDMGIRPKDLAAVILTHYHHDHTGGLSHFPHTRILGPRDGFALAQSAVGMVQGCLPQRWPIWLRERIELFDLTGPAVGPFPVSYPITTDGTLFAVPTPGHFQGHISVVARDGAAGLSYFFAGDASYNQANLLSGRTDGVTNHPEQAAQTLERIQAFAQQEPTIYLPAHDPESVLRLAARSAVI